MLQDYYRFEFSESMDVDKAKQSLVLALILTEILHGETAAQLGATYQFEADRRECRVYVEGTVGRHFNLLVTGLLNLRFGADSFRLVRVSGRKPGEVKG